MTLFKSGRAGHAKISLLVSLLLVLLTVIQPLGNGRAYADLDQPIYTGVNTWVNTNNLQLNTSFSSIAGNNEGVYVVTTNNPDKVFYVDNDGSTVQISATGLGGLLTDIAVDGDNNLYAYTLPPDRGTKNAYKLTKTEDGWNSSWERLGQNLTNPIAITASGANDIYIATTEGILKWNSTGSTWDNFSISGISTTAITDIALTSDNNYLYVSEKTGEIWKYNLINKTKADVAATLDRVITPRSLALDFHNNLYVLEGKLPPATPVNEVNSKVYRLMRSSWTQLATLDKTYAISLAVDENFEVYSNIQDLSGANLYKLQAKIAYNGNGGSGAPSDPVYYSPGQTATVLGAGDLVRDGYAFAGWSTSSGATTAEYAPSSHIDPTQNMTLYAVWTEGNQVAHYTVSYQAGENGSIASNQSISETVEAGNKPVSVPDVTYNEGYEFAGWSSTGGIPLLTAAQVKDIAVTGDLTYTAYFKAVTNPETPETTPTPTPTATPESTIAPESPAIPGSAVNSTPTPAPVPAAGTNIQVLVNGKAENIGTSTTAQSGNVSSTLITVDSAQLQAKLNAEGRNAVVTVPVSSASNTIATELTGEMIKNMENVSATLVLQTAKGSYTLPANQININALSSALGAGTSFKDISVRITISDADSANAQVVQNAAANGGFTAVTAPLDFTVTASYNGKSQAVTTFNAYVSRTVLLPDGIDPSRITTGIVVNADGSVRHVPTTVVQIDGKYYARINSLTNSTYSVVWHPVTFADVNNHWAKDAVNDMGSRMVVTGVTYSTFLPDEDITRAEFAAIVVRGLGLPVQQGSTSYTDVTADAWYAGAVATASSYGLLTGFEDKTFRPNDKITREQAIVILAKAMKLTGLAVPLASADTALAGFTDAASTGSWAKDSVASTVNAGLISGRDGGKLMPKATITRAEAATLIQRLLKKSNLI